MHRPVLRARESNAGLEVEVHVQVRARSTAVAGLHDGALKLRVAAPPVDNAANEAVVRLLSSLLAVPRSRVHIVSGMKSREKTVRIDGFSLQAFCSIPEIRELLSSAS